jgi:hypothetical protein
MERLLMRSAALALLSLASAGAHAEGPLDLTVDLRLVASEGPTSYLYGGLGKLRFDEEHDALQVGRLRAAWSQSLGETFYAHVDASLWRPGDDNAFDLTEAYLEYRPYPAGGWRSRVKVGAFYAPISLEHRAAGWTNPYLINSSAINTWVGEELRTVGAEYSLEWLGTRSGHDFDAQLVAGVYGYNDPAGVLVASRGWALHDRQTTLFGEVGEAGEGPVPGRVLFAEIDDRAGYYAGMQLRYFDRLELRLMHYDNNADPAQYDSEIDDFAWLTVFDAIGLRMETVSGWTVMSQWLGGETSIMEGSSELWEFESQFLLVSRAIGRHRFSARGEWFETYQVKSSWPSPFDESGDALTIGYSYEHDRHWNLSVEAIRIESDVSARASIGEPVSATEKQLQLQLRYSL